MTLQLLDFFLSILTLCSSYMEVPTYLNFKSMNHMVSLGTARPCSLGQANSPLGALVLRLGFLEDQTHVSALLRQHSWEESCKE